MRGDSRDARRGAFWRSGIAGGLALVFVLAACSGSCDGGAQSPAGTAASPTATTRAATATLKTPDHVRATMTFADANWADTVADGVSAILVARIEEVTPSPPPEEGLLTGTARLTVVRDVSAPRWKGPATLFTGYSQYESPIQRGREGNLGWNGVELSAGKLVLIATPAAPPTSAPAVGPLAAVSVAPLAAPDDPLVTGVEKALAIEAEKEPQRRAALLRDGGKSALPFLPGYSHYAIGRLGRLPRRDAVALEIDLLGDPNAADRALSTLATALFQDDAPTDPLNKQIVAAFFQALLGHDADRVKSALGGLYNMLEGENPSANDHRSQLLEDVVLPPRPQLQAALKTLEADPEVGADARWLSGFLAKRP